MNGAAYTTSVHYLDRNKFVKGITTVIMLAGEHCCHTVDLWKNFDVVCLAEEPLHMRYEFCLQENLMFSAQAINMGERANMATSIVRCKETITENIGNMPSYAVGTREGYIVSFDAMFNLVILNHMTSSSFPLPSLDCAMLVVRQWIIHF